MTIAQLHACPLLVVLIIITINKIVLFKFTFIIDFQSALKSGVEGRRKSRTKTGPTPKGRIESFDRSVGKGRDRNIQGIMTLS